MNPRYAAFLALSLLSVLFLVPAGDAGMAAAEALKRTRLPWCRRRRRGSFFVCAHDSARLRYAASVVRYDQSQVNLPAALGLLYEGTLTTTPNSDGNDAESSSTEGQSIRANRIAALQPWQVSRVPDARFFAHDGFRASLAESHPPPAEQEIGTFIDQS